MESTNFYVVGGPYMNYISAMLLLALVVMGIKVRAMVKKNFDFRLLDLILMAGSLALALGLLSQITGIVQALESIRIAGDISKSLLLRGVEISFYPPIYGFIVFIFSMLVYFILKEIIKEKQQ
jgi:hypothetical protein